MTKRRSIEETIQHRFLLIGLLTLVLTDALVAIEQYM